MLHRIEIVNSFAARLVGFADKNKDALIPDDLRKHLLTIFQTVIAKRRCIVARRRDPDAKAVRVCLARLLDDVVLLRVLVCV